MFLRGERTSAYRTLRQGVRQLCGPVTRKALEGTDDEKNA